MRLDGTLFVGHLRYPICCSFKIDRIGVGDLVVSVLRWCGSHIGHGLYFDGDGRFACFGKGKRHRKFVTFFQWLLRDRGEFR